MFFLGPATSKLDAFPILSCSRLEPHQVELAVDWTYEEAAPFGNQTLQWEIPRIWAFWLEKHIKRNDGFFRNGRYTNSVSRVHTLYTVCFCIHTHIYIYILIICHNKIESNPIQSNPIQSNLTECRLIYVSIYTLGTHIWLSIQTSSDS